MLGGGCGAGQGVGQGAEGRMRSFGEYMQHGGLLTIVLGGLTLVIWLVLKSADIWNALMLDDRNEGEDG